MPGNPYNAPKAQLTEEVDVTSQRLYVVSASKLTILYVATFGMYIYYWFYANWLAYKKVGEVTRWPIARSFFYFIFAYSLFEKIAAEYEIDKKSFSWYSGAWAIALIFSVLLTYGVDLIDDPLDELSPAYAIASIVGMVISLYVLLKAQTAINVTQNDAQGVSNRRLTGWNYLWILLGVPLWLLSLAAIAGEEFMISIFSLFN